jgi:hypothetical protein
MSKSISKQESPPQQPPTSYSKLLYITPTASSAPATTRANPPTSEEGSSSSSSSSSSSPDINLWILRLLLIAGMLTIIIISLSHISSSRSSRVSSNSYTPTGTA